MRGKEFKLSVERSAQSSIPLAASVQLGKPAWAGWERNVGGAGDPHSFALFQWRGRWL